MSDSRKAIGAGMAALLVVAIGAAIWLYAQQTGVGKASGDDLGRFAVGEMAELETPDTAAPTTERAFETRDGDPARLSDFRGRVVVLNLWATWCAPCLAEMPTLAALARDYAGEPDLLVLPISVDVADQRARAEAFLGAHAPLAFYNDPTFQLPFEFGGRGGMPQTILLDRQGRVRAMLTGGADWSGPEAKALIDALLAEPS